jgi:hypothetical protein
MAYRFTIGLAALCLATAALGGQVYRWQDDSGQIHYGQQPPSDVKAKPVNTPRNQTAERNAQQATAKDQSSSDESSDSAGTVDKEYTKKQCRKARTAVTNLKDGGPDGRYTNENDEIIKYSKKEYNQRLKKNQKFIRRFCKNDGGEDGSEQANSG